LFSFLARKENPLRITLRWTAASGLSGLLLLSGLWGVASPAHANQELVMKKNCMACHYVDKRKYGPSFQQVAAKYADQKNAAEVLARKIRRGGTGVWGVDVMPPQPQVSAAEARALAAYVLSLK
jgi:cytochrome c